MSEERKKPSDEVTAPTKVAPVVKDSPLPSPEHLRKRFFIVLSFWSIVIFLGLPIWWHTTSIYRAPLPMAEMMEWADGRACRPVFPLQISVEAPSLQRSEAQHLVRTTQHALDDLNEFSAHHLRLRLVDTWTLKNGTAEERLREQTTRPSAETDDGAEMLESTGQEDTTLYIHLQPAENVATTPSAFLSPSSPSLTIYYNPLQILSSSASSSPLASFIANHLHEIFSEEQATIAYILSSSSYSYVLTNPPSRAPPIPPSLAASLQKRSTRALKYASTYHLTISLFTPTYTPSSWDIDSALEATLNPLLQTFSSISNFTIDTQLQLYASPSPSTPRPVWSDELRAYKLPPTSLSGFINAAEWPLSPSIGPNPTINLVIYVPQSSLSPLTIFPHNTTSWLIPQWGAVSILNLDPSSLKAAHLSEADLLPPLRQLTPHLLTLLGLPHTPVSIPLRLQSLMRTHTLSLLLSSSSTLGSLARLAHSLPSIPIPRSVLASVRSCLSHLHETCTLLKDGKFEAALTKAREAERESETAFFEKSMVGQVYFPDEHKVAVYMPLLGPIGVPLVMGGVKEVVRVLQAWKGRSREAKA